ncbi:uncharacterized protein LOC133779498 [Humulus lupulus]|uniref:uncharacterized protein LOC133779498 n=1 Tax=Humulus lupulus TaxID=3486 RepID=UPI002B40F36C|nr:uncharacterized protein LOC133779498 [Humulus lupulus]
MNFNIGSPSESSYSDAENDDDANLTNDIDALITMNANNNICMVRYLNQLNNEAAYGGPVLGHRTINHDRESSYHNFFNNYFSENAHYNDSMFRHRFRMSQTLFLHIANVVIGHDNYFEQRRVGMGKLGLSSLQKITDVFQLLVYGIPTDVADEYINIGESTTIESLKRFCRAIVEDFAEQYIRSPNANEISRLLHVGKERGFQGMLSSIDCMHWK